MACSELAKPTYEGLHGLSPTTMPQRQLFDIVCRTHMCPSYTSYGVGSYSDLVMLGPYLPPHRWWQPAVLMVMEGDILGHGRGSGGSILHLYMYGNLFI
jgi:hypothetical protein